MVEAERDRDPGAVLAGWVRGAVAVVVVFAALDWVGWATGTGGLTRVFPAWPPMTPWTAAWLAALGVALLVQSGSPPPARVWAGRGVAVAVGAMAVVVLAEYASGRSFGVDQVWFGHAVRNLQSSWPGRPSSPTAVSIVFLSAAVGLTRVDRRWSRGVWVGCLLVAVATPWVTVLAYLFKAVALVNVAASTGMAMGTALGLLLLGAATFLVRSDRNPVAWLLSRPNRGILIRVVGVFASFPIIVGVSRRIFLGLGLGDDTALTLSTAVGTVTVGALAFYLGRREQHLLEATESDRALLHASSDGMLDPQVLLAAVRDPAGQVLDFRYVSANRATYLYLEVTAQELIGRSVLDTLPNLVGSGLLTRYAQCLQDGEPVILTDFSYVNEILDDDRRYDIRATRAGPDLLTLTWEDVTDRFHAAQRIAASEKRYRLLAENSSDLVAHVRDGRFVWTSPSVAEVLGSPAEYWVGRTAQEIIPPEEASDFARRLAILAAGGTVQERLRVVAVDGVTHWIDMHAKPFYDDDGRQDGFTAALRVVDDEVAAQQEADEARRQQAIADARYRRSMDSSAVGMCMLAPDGRFREVNPALCDLLGYDARTLMGKTWQDVTAPGYLDVGEEERQEVFDGIRDSYRIVKQYVHADGQLIWADVAVSCVRDETGQVETLAAQIADITAEVHAREQLARSDEKNRALAQLLQQQSDRLADELRSAADYMASIMPRGLDGAVRVESRYLPSRELGGDCFDYIWIDDDHLLVYLIDVSGHGIEPALLSVSVHNMLRSGSLGIETLLAPEAALAALNGLFQMDDQDGHFFTIWYGVYQTSTRTLRYATAGAPPALAIHLADDGDVTLTELSTPAEPIGMFDDTEFTSNTYTVPPGDRILIFSDGAWELGLSEGKSLSFAEFTELNTRLAASSSWSLDGLVKELKTLTPTGVFADDCSLIQLTFT